MKSMRVLMAFAALVVCSVPGGCMDSDEGGAPSGPTRLNSVAGFQGKEKQIAEVVERFEAAVLADDVKTICRELLAVRENRGYDNDNGGQDFCVVDPANQPDQILAASGGAESYDLVVRSIERMGVKPALFRVSAKVRTGHGVQEFMVERHGGAWEITGRDFSNDDAFTGLPEDTTCEELGSMDVRSTRLVPRAKYPRTALIQGPFGSRVKNTLVEGGALELENISYRPDYVVTYVLKDGAGKYLGGFPVRVWGPRSFDVSSMDFCRNGQQRSIII